MKIVRKQMKVEVPSMAMGDIAFNLLVFFVILARSTDESSIQWTPAKTARLESAGHSKVSIILDREGKLFLNGRQIGEMQVEQLVNEALGDAPAGERTVLLKIHNDAQAYRFQPILEGVSKAGGELVHVLDREQPAAPPS